MKKLLFSLFIAFLTGLVPALSQPQGLPAFITDSLDVYINREMARWKIPGAAVAVVKDGKAVIQRGYGIRELGKTGTVDENTLFMIGSNTKAFTATAVAMLAGEGKCSLNDPVKKWVPYFTMVDPWVEEHATLTDVLSHRMGMETFQGDFMVFDSDLTSREIIAKIGALTPEHPFRTTWGYFNTGYLIAGEAIRSISGLSWADFIRQRFFRPLGMDRTLALTSEITAASNRAVAHTLVNGNTRVIDYGQIDAVGPAGSISSSVSDMSRWLIAQLEADGFPIDPIIPSGAVNETRQPRTIMATPSPLYNKAHFQLYGLGWELQDYEGYEVVSHTGGIHGFVSAVTLVPEAELGIVVLTNTDHNAFYEALKQEIVDAFLGLPYRNYSKAYHGYLSMQDKAKEKQIQSWKDAAAQKPALPLPLSAFAGVYVHDVYGQASLTAVGDHLVMKFEHHPKLEAELRYIGNNTFLASYNIPIFGAHAFPFELEGNKVKAFNLSLSPSIEKGTYYFEKKG